MITTYKLKAFFNDFIRLPIKSRGKLLTMVSKKPLIGVLFNKPKISIDKVDFDSYRKIGGQILEKLQDFKTYFPFKLKKLKESKKYKSLGMQDYIDAVQDSISLVDESAYYKRLEKSFSKLNTQVALNKVLTRIESSPELHLSFLESIDKIVAPYDLVVSDLLEHEDLLFPKSSLDAENLEILKTILGHQEINLVSSKLKSMLKLYADDVYPINSEGSRGLKIDEETSLITNRTLVDEEALSLLIDQFERNDIEGHKVLQKQSDNTSYLHRSSILELVNFLQKQSSFSPSFIASNIGSFFPDKSPKVQQLWIKLLSYIKDPNDLTIDRSDFSSIPKLKQLFEKTDSVNHPSLLFLIHSHSSLANLVFKPSSDNQAFFSEIEVDVREILNDPKSLFEIYKFFRDNPNYSLENIEKIPVKVLSSLKAIFNRINESQKNKLYQIFSNFVESNTLLSPDLVFKPSFDNQAFFSEIEVDVPKILNDPKSLFEIYKFFRDNPNYSLENIEKIPVKVLSSLKAIFNRINESQKNKLYQIFSNFVESNTLLSPDLVFKPSNDDKVFFREIKVNVPKILNDPKTLFEIYEFFRDNPNYSPENIEKIPTKELSSLKEIFKRIDDSQKIKLYHIFSHFVKSDIMFGPDLVFKPSSDNQAFFSEIEVDVREILNDPKSLFEIYKFFRDNPNYSLENIEKIPVKVLSSLKAIFNRINESQKIKLYHIFSNFVQSNTMLSPNKQEELLLKPIKDDLENYDFVNTLAKSFKKMINSRLVARPGYCSISNTLFFNSVNYRSKRKELAAKLSLRIIKAQETKQGVSYKESIKQFEPKIFQHFWYEGNIEPTVPQILDYVKNLQGISRRNFLQALTGAVAVGGFGALAVNQYQEAQFQEYLAKDFNITDKAIDDPKRHLLYENIFLQDLNKFLNSLKKENEQFNREAKETLFGEGNLDIPELIDLEPGSIIVANNFTRRDLSYSFKENDDGTVKIVSKSLRRFDPKSLNNALKEAFKDTPDIDPQTAINPLTNKTYYKSAEDFFKTSFEEFRLTDRVFCPYYAFINPNGKLRIIVEPETANLCFSPFKSVDNLINILPVNKEADRNNKFFNAYQKNLQTHFKMTQLEADRNISEELVPEYRVLLERYGNRLDFNNEDQMNEYKDLLKKVDSKLEKKFNSFRTALKDQRDQTSLIRILNMEWWYSLQNYSNMSNLSASSLVGNLSRSLASNRDQLQKLVLQHDNRPVSTTFSAIEEKLKNSNLVKFTIENLTEGIVSDDNGKVA